MAKKQTEAKAPAIIDHGTQTAIMPQSAANVSGFKVVRRITMPTVNPGVNQPRIFRIDDAFRISTYKNPDSTKANEKPATICTITDMQTGEVLLWLVAEVAHKNIEEGYPDQTYIGKIFGVQKLPKRPGKRYFDFEVVEVVEVEAS